MPPVAKKTKKQIQKVLNTEAEEEEEIKGESVVSAQLQKKLDRKAKNRRNRPERGVVVVRHLPHGFFEDQLKKYFEQFGLVTRLRLARSRKTGGTKGFAFVEFAVPEVGKVAAETMNNYLMFKKIVQANYIPPEEQKFNYFKSKVRKVTTPLGKEIYVSGKTKLAHYKVKQNNIWNQFNYEKRTKNGIKKLNKLKKKYADLGLNFDEMVVKPKLLPAKANDEIKTEDEKANISQEQSDDNEVGSLLLIKKRKLNTSNQKQNIKLPKLPKAAGKEDLKQLLDKTLEEVSSSEDDDYLPNNFEKATSENETNSSDEETNTQVLFNKDTNKKKEKTKLHTKLQRPKKDLLEKIMRRKTNLSGIQKHKNKILKSKNTTVNVAKEKMKSSAAKEIVKTTTMQKLKKINLKKKVRK